MTKKVPLIGLTPGSETGVGPELMLRALHDNALQSRHFFWCGDKRSLERAAQSSKFELCYTQNEAELANGKKLIFLDAVTSEDPLERQALFLASAANLGLAGDVRALVTGPIEKAALSYLGDFPGQTEYFAQKWGKRAHKPFMAFTGGPFILSLLTTHVPLAQVHQHISTAVVQDFIIELVEAIAPMLGKSSKAITIDVLGLNPHAGENGLLGHEEQQHIIPALHTLKNAGYKVEGPWPADGYFAYHDQRPNIDAVVAMYHDQGLAPYKLLCQGNAVNITFGLRIPRLSPAHGTASHLRGTGLACPRSTIRAILLAEQMSDSRANFWQQ